MNVLVACEESQAVTTRLRAKSIVAYSCDIQPTSGPLPEYHIQDDVTRHLGGWDAIIAFPPCTHLASSGARWFAEKRADGRQQQGIDLFMACINAPAAKIAVENPIGIMSSEYRKPDQIIQPWQFGHPETKATCLWLKGFDLLKPTDNVRDEMLRLPKSQRNRIHHMPPCVDRGKLRSKTYDGIANAIAEQWFKEV